MEQFLRVGVISSPHGVHGEVKVFPTTDSPKRFEEIDEVIIKARTGDVNTKITKVRYFNNMAIVKFDCFQAPEEARKYIGADIFIDRKIAQPLEEGEYYIADLIGCKVLSDEGENLGTLKDVLQTGANDVYIVEGADKKELLFPVIKECIKQVDIVNSVITVHIMKGLLD